MVPCPTVACSGKVIRSPILPETDTTTVSRQLAISVRQVMVMVDMRYDWGVTLQSGWQQVAPGGQQNSSSRDIMGVAGRGDMATLACSHFEIRKAVKLEKLVNFLAIIFN